MDIVRWDETPIEPLADGLGRQVVNTDLLTVARIHLAAGAVVAGHAHSNEQIANVLAGRLRFTVGEETETVSAGESLVIPPDVPHGVEALEDSLVLDVFAPRREDWLAGDDAYLRGDA